MWFKRQQSTSLRVSQAARLAGNGFAVLPCLALLTAAIGQHAVKHVQYSVYVGAASKVEPSCRVLLLDKSQTKAYDV